MPWILGLVLAIILAAPGLLALTPGGYDLMNSAHFVVLLLAVVVLVWLGRFQARRGRRAGRVGLVVGVVAGAAGSVGSALIMQTPPAVRAFVQYVGRNGVPPAAAVTLHALHLVASTMLNALLSAGFYALLGALAAWWGARTVLRIRTREAKADPST